MTIEVETGVERDVVFRCRHRRIDAVISWQINGSFSRLYPDVVDSFIQDSNGTHVDTLTIPAIPEYNETEVAIVCMAIFFDGSPEVTPPAELIVIGMLAGLYQECYLILNGLLHYVTSLNSGSCKSSNTRFDTTSTHCCGTRYLCSHYFFPLHDVHNFFCIIL